MARRADQKVDTAFLRLPSTQKRIRHLSEIAGRNFTRINSAMLDVYFTLHERLSNGEIAGSHFYKSEMMRSTLNPSWAPFSSAAFGNVELANCMLVVRVWRVDSDDNSHTIFFEWDLDLQGLTFLASDLRDLTTSLPKNTIVFRLSGYWFGADSLSSAAENELKASIQEKGIRVDKSKVVPSYSESSLESTLEQLATLGRVQIEQQQLRAELARRMALSTQPVQLLQARSSYAERLANLRAEVQQAQNLLTQDETQIQLKKDQLDQRRADLSIAQERLKQQIASLTTVSTEVLQGRETQRQAMVMLADRRSSFLRSLMDIYMIKQFKSNPPMYSIGNLALPNSDYTGYDDEHIATALGWTCHVVLMTAHYCEVPLIFAMTAMGSRSTIRDDVFGGQEFPLYARGVDRFRFDYGVFLLNKNIEQLVTARGYPFVDLRQTLPNIHTLLVNEIDRKSRKATAAAVADHLVDTPSTQK